MAGKGRGVRVAQDEESMSVTLRIQASLLARIDAWRKDLDIPRSEAIRQALDLFFKQK